MNSNTKIDNTARIDNACKIFKKVNESNHPKFAKLDYWLEKESYIFDKETQNIQNQYLKYKRGQIIKIDFGVNIGTELSHTHFAIVLNDDDTISTDNITVLPLTSKKGYKRINLGHLIKSEKYQNNITYGIITQIKTISKQRILLNNKKIFCDKELLKKINLAIKNYIIIN